MKNFEYDLKHAAKTLKINAFLNPDKTANRLSKQSLNFPKQQIKQCAFGKVLIQIYKNQKP